jgi:transposase
MDKDSRLFVGMDIGDRMIETHILDSEGQLVEESRVPTREAALRRKFSALPASRVAIEVGTHSHWVSRSLSELGHKVLVANARKLGLIHGNTRKSDQADAEHLARLARLDPGLLSPIRHRGAQAQADLALVRSRDSLVRARTLLINHARGLVKSSGQRLATCSAESFATRAVADIPADLQPALRPILESVAHLTGQIRAHDRQIERVAKERYPVSERLRQVKGVGPVTSLAFVLTLEDPARFAKSREVGAYLGLVPRRHQSGDIDPQMRISKTGDSHVRRLLVGSAQYILGPFGPDCDLRRWGLRLAERGGQNGRKRAVVAVARKLAVILHRLWITGEDYQAQRCSTH